jgi:hypothetical protein
MSQVFLMMHCMYLNVVERALWFRSWMRWRRFFSFYTTANVRSLLVGRVVVGTGGQVEIGVSVYITPNVSGNRKVSCKYQCTGKEGGVSMVDWIFSWTVFN